MTRSVAARALMLVAAILATSLSAPAQVAPPAAAQNPFRRVTLVGFSAGSFAQAAVRGDKRFVITHSEIFPGTFASTTETADYLLNALGLKRTPVLEWGPRGMQQLVEVHSGRFELLSFAGNTAPDHVDHLQGMPEFLERLSK